MNASGPLVPETADSQTARFCATQNHRHLVAHRLFSVAQNFAFLAKICGLCSPSYERGSPRPLAGRPCSLCKRGCVWHLVAQNFAFLAKICGFSLPQPPHLSLRLASC